MPEQDKPELTVIAHRPVKVLHTLKSSSGVLVQCRLPSGEDTFVPLEALFAAFERELVTKIKMQMGGV